MRQALLILLGTSRFSWRTNISSFWDTCNSSETKQELNEKYSWGNKIPLSLSELLSSLGLEER